MKKGLLIILGVIVLLVVLWDSFFVSKFNSLVELNENTSKAWTYVEIQYQFRADLIPNLVNTMKDFVEQEKAVLIGVTEARSNAISMKIDPSNITAENMQQFQAAQGELSSALSRLLVTVERDLDIKSNHFFLELQAQLEETENRIFVEGRRFNETVNVYN